MLHNIPSELKELPQWVVSGPDKVPLNPRTGRAASVIDPSTWGTFDEACRSGYAHVGFVLSENDPYTIIDLDNKPERPLRDDQKRLHERILAEFETYTERSASGRGFHLIVKGRLPAGVNNKAASLELYSTARYMVCTGNVVRQSPIMHMQEGIDALYLAFHNDTPAINLDEDYQGLLDDRDLVEMASNAVNREKYIALCQGKWQDLGFPSQSEADFALMSMLAFYTRDNEQCRRLFRYSALGQREKATRDNVYVDRMLRKIRAAQPPPMNFPELAARAAAVVSSGSEETTDNPGNLGKSAESAVEAPENTPSPTYPTPLEPPPLATITAADFPDRFRPPGLIGELAEFGYWTSVRPVWEVAFTMAVGLVAGVGARVYSVSGTGLNQYLILLAKTGSGKEGIASSMNRMVAAVRPQVPAIDQFIGPSAFASGQSLIKVLDEKPSFVSVLGEFGLTLQQICDPRANSAQVMIRKVLLDLYTKSGPTDVLRSSVYADTEKNTKVVQSPAVTLVGESTPERFYENIDATHVAEGLIPRFSVIEYTGKRPDLNKFAGCPPSAQLVDNFVKFASTCLAATGRNACFAVQIDPEAEVIMAQVDRYATDIINSTSSDVESQLWNRAHLKVLKLAALVAVGVNWNQPIVTPAIAQWARDFVYTEVQAMSTRFKVGDVGTGDQKMHHDLKQYVAIYLKSTYDQVKTYGVELQMHKDRVVPWVYLQRKTASLTAFRSDRRGAGGALRAVVQDAIDGGVIVEIPTSTMQSRYNTRARAFAVGPAWNAS